MLLCLALVVVSADAMAVSWHQLFEKKQVDDPAVVRANLPELMRGYGEELERQSMGQRNELSWMEQGLRSITNPEVAEILWQYMESVKGKPGYAAAKAAVVQVGRQIETIRARLLDEIKASATGLERIERTRELIKGGLQLSSDVFASLTKVLVDEAVPESARASFGSDLFHRLAREDSLRASAEVREAVLAVLGSVESPAVMKELARLVGQTASAGPETYAAVRTQIVGGQIAPEMAVALLSGLSYEVNGSINAAIKDLPAESREQFYELTRAASKSPVPGLRAGALTICIWQDFNKTLPSDLQTWLKTEAANDGPMLEEYRAIFEALDPRSKKMIETLYPAFKKPLRPGFLCGLARAATFWRK
jgi:hypothetical protein